jgi:hypothetical protein
MNKDFVPAEGENIVLGNTTNLHQGARPVDATDDVHPSYIALVEGAIALFPGLMMARRYCNRKCQRSRGRKLPPQLCGTS